MSGFQEPPAISTVARGRIVFQIEDDMAATYRLGFEGLEGPVTQAHIHLGQRSVNGGIMVWLCGTTTNPGPAGTPACAAQGEVGGTITAATVIGPAGQGVAAGEFAEFLRAVRSGNAYANVHSSKFPGGEIRGQLQRDDD
ncbi:MAG TPA: CHRD domain-containing protein [Candidatus Acidoferrales bacterium]